MRLGCNRRWRRPQPCAPRLQPYAAHLLEGEEVEHVGEVLVGRLHTLADEGAHLGAVGVLDGVEEGARPADARQDGHVSGVALRHHHITRGADADGTEHSGKQPLQHITRDCAERSAEEGEALARVGANHHGHVWVDLADDVLRHVEQLGQPLPRDVSCEGAVVELEGLVLEGHHL
eukprot:scaffold131984_cov36-Phaeocystis_antarctica.AAC.1